MFLFVCFVLIFYQNQALVAAAQMLLAGGMVVGVRVGLRAGWCGGQAGRLKILLWPRPMSPWVGQGWGREGRQSTTRRMNQL